MRTVFLALLLFVSSMGQAQTVYSETFVGPRLQNSIDLRQPLVRQELAAHFDARTSRRAEAGEEVRWIDRIHNLPTHLQEFYVTYGNLVHQVLAGGQNGLSDTYLCDFIDSGNNHYLCMKTFEETIGFTYPANATKEEIAQYAANAVMPVYNQQWEETDTFMPYLSMCLSYDYPEGFWLDTSFSWGNSLQYQCSYIPGGTTGSVHYQHMLVFMLKGNNFNHLRDEFLDPHTLASAVTEYNEKVNQLVAACPGGAQPYNKIVFLNDWLTKNNAYNSAYGKTTVDDIAWSPLSALRGSTGATGPVCEGYARAFKLLCDQLDIPCVLVTGVARNSQDDTGELHMWNEVKMENGKWYAVDVTWNDPYDKLNRKVSGLENESWLLLGSQDLVTGNMTFEESHPFSIIWVVNPEKENVWDLNLKSFITNQRYDFSTGIATSILSRTTTAPLRYGIGGQRLGDHTSGIVITDGRKVLKRIK